MDVTRFAESDYVNAELIKSCKNNKAVIISDAKITKTEYGERMEFDLDIDKKRKTYRPSKDTIRNLIFVFGSETQRWLGKQIELSVYNFKGKECVLGRPLSSSPTVTHDILVTK